MAGKVHAEEGHQGVHQGSRIKLKAALPMLASVDMLNDANDMCDHNMLDPLETPETEFSSRLQDVMACELYFDPKGVGSNELCRLVHAMAHTARPVARL